MKLGDERIALFALIALAIWIFVALPLTYLPDGFAKSLHDWQTLIGAGVALLAATIAFHNTTRSLEQAKLAEENRRKRKHAAVRAILPLALSEISDYAASTVRALKELLAKCEGEHLPKEVSIDGIEIQLPTQSLSVLAEFIEYSEEKGVKILETALARIQIHNSRLRHLALSHSRDDSVVVKSQLETYIVDAALINAGASAYFAYARGGKDLPTDLQWNDVYSALRNMDVGEDSYPRIFADLSGREQLLPHP